MGAWQSQPSGDEGQNLPPPLPPPAGSTPAYGGPPAPPPPPGYGGPGYPMAPRGGIPPVALAAAAIGVVVLAGIGVLYFAGRLGPSTPTPTPIIERCPPFCPPTEPPNVPTAPPNGLTPTAGFPTVPPNPATPTPNGGGGGSDQLPGLWLGTIDMGACGQASTLIYFGSDGSWSMNLKSPVVNPNTQCADVSMTGQYASQGTTISVTASAPNCELYGTCNVHSTLSYQFNTAAAVELCDTGAANGLAGLWGGTCITFYRQSQ